MHNYTRDITATRPENFAELTEEEKALIKKLGVYIKAGGLGATRFFSFSGRRQARYLVMLWMTCQTPPFPVFDTPSKTCLGKGCYTRTQFPGAPNGNRAHLYERESDSGDLWVSEQL